MAEHDSDRVITRTLVRACVAALVGTFALSVWAYLRLPDDALVPLHWGMDGQVDDYAGKFTGLFLPVGVFALVIGLLLVIPRIEPRRENLARSATAYRATVYGTIVFFVALHLLIVATALGSRIDVNTVVPIGVGALLVVIGNWLPKTRSNFMFGIRTPWTLTSDHTWRRTHTVGGRIMVALGLLAIVAGVVAPPQAAAAMLGAGAAVMAVGLMAYSYVVWRNAPDRRPRDGAR